MDRRWTARGRTPVLVLLGLLLAGCGQWPAAEPEPTGPTARTTRGPAATPTPDEPRPRPRAVFAEVQALLRNAVDVGFYPGVAAYVRVGEESRVLVSGEADTRTGAPVTAAHRFAVASVTKPMVAAVVLQLVHEGRLTLDDTVEDLLPGLLAHGDRVTVRHLLSHTSGVPELLAAPGLARLARDDPRPSARDTVALVAEAPLDFAPGARFAYSNTNFVVLGLVVEELTGATLDRALERRVFAPAGMRGASLDLGPRPGGPVAHGYLGGEDVVALTDVPPGFDAAGGALMRVGDAGAFLDALVAGRLVLQPELGRMQADLVDGPAEGWTGYGLGLARLGTRCGTAVGHTGLTEGYVTEAWTLPGGEGTVVVAGNRAESFRARLPLRAVIEAGLCG